MKGVILGICPAARLVDLTHELPPHDVRAGQLALEGGVPFFPPGTIHLAVVDPGVGTARRPLLVAARGQYFVGPDNGLFTFAMDGDDWSAVAIEAPDLRLPRVSATFHGRDVFAPAAAHLACGTDPGRFGPTVTDAVRAPLPEARHDGAAVLGEVLLADRFGNLVTSIRAGDLDRMGGTGALDVAVGDARLGPPRESYSSVPPGRPAAIVGSSGRVEIFVREGSAAAALGAHRGTPVKVRRGSGL